MKTAKCKQVMVGSSSPENKNQCKNDQNDEHIDRNKCCKNRTLHYHAMAFLLHP